MSLCIEVSTVIRPELIKIVTPYLPVYVITDDDIFIAHDISTRFFRDKKRIEMYSIKSKEPSPIFPKCNKLNIQSGQLIVSDLKVANEHFRMKKAQKVKKEYSFIKEKYLDYTDFIKNNPELFII